MTNQKYPTMSMRKFAPFPYAMQHISVGRTRSVEILNHVRATSEQHIVCLAQKDADVSNPEPGDLHKVGTLCSVVKVTKHRDYFKVFVKGLRRVKLVNMDTSGPFDMGEFEEYPVKVEGTPEESALHKALKAAGTKYLSTNPEASTEAADTLQDSISAEELCCFLAGELEMEAERHQDILESETLSEMLQKTLNAFALKQEEAEMELKLQQKMAEDTQKSQREYLIRQKIRALRKELGEEDDLDLLADKVEEADLPEEVYEAAMKQVDRLRTMQPSSSEFSVTLNYVETLVEIPWSVHSEDNLDLESAQDVLDADHYGLDKVKDRIIEYLAVCKLKNDMKGPILCLSGPPGVGKTSLGKSVARALGRKFQRISLGGVSDESEIRGHRRTYVGAMPGRLVKALMKSGTNNPVIMLDEIDKLGKSFRGDPQAAMLEVLDPEQNANFSDHFVEVPVDLSNVLFIATANQLENISAPLRDRMEIIQVPSYTLGEKYEIASRHLIPKQLDRNGITAENLTFNEDAVRFVISNYTREAGVRNLEREIGKLCRSVAVEVAKTAEEDRDGVSITCTEDYVADKLGPVRFLPEVAQRSNVAGVSTGLAWTQVGGGILFVEASQMPGTGKLKFTGQLGDVMKESVQAAMTYLRTNAAQFGLTQEAFSDNDFHVHFPAGAIPKDGPSAGVTIFTAVLSAMTGVKVKADVAMTGEITLRGQVLPVGGIKEKLTAAHRAGIRTVLIPAQCEKDLVELSDEVKNDLEIHFLERVEQIPALVLEGALPTLPLGDEFAQSETETN